MATATKKPRVTAAMLKEENDQLKQKLEWYESSASCYLCGKHKIKTKFYKSSNSKSEMGITPVCIDCATDIARRKDVYGEYHPSTKESVMTALFYIDKPFLVSVWDASYFEYQNSKDKKNQRKDIWGYYIKNISMINYTGLRWKDSDHLKNNPIKIDMGTDVPRSVQKEEKKNDLPNTEIEENYKANKLYTIRQIGYDPFANYPDDGDLPMLYATLVSFMDDETKNDGMKMRAVIQIVKAFNQIEKLNDKIDELVTNPDLVADKAAVITKLTEAVKGFISSSSTLAKDNGINAQCLCSVNCIENPSNCWKTLKTIKLQRNTC